MGCIDIKNSGLPFNLVLVGMSCGLLQEHCQTAAIFAVLVYTSTAFVCAFVCCGLLNVPATCECISGTDLLGQFYVLPH